MRGWRLISGIVILSTLMLAACGGAEQPEPLAFRVVAHLAFPPVRCPQRAARARRIWAPVSGTTSARVAVEAAASLGWDRYLAGQGKFIGMSGFGASAPAGALFEHFGITPSAVVDAVKAQLQ